MDKRNFLLGKGENLTHDVTLPSGFGNKKHPYSFSEAKTRLVKMLDTVVTGLDALPAIACPGDYAVATLTLNPEYIAKAYFPTQLLRNAGLETVGSRPRKITPEKQTRKGDIKETLTTEIFVKGTRRQFAQWMEKFDTLDENSKADLQIREIEAISFPAAESKLKNIPQKNENIVYEVVLHLDKAQAENGFLDMFRTYLSSLGIETELPHRFYASGLCFVGFEAPASSAASIATFSLVRVLRTMPELRILNPAMRAAYKEKQRKVELPKSLPLDKSIKVALFDGGIPADHPLTTWVTPKEFPGMLPPHEDLLEHGVAVTSAFLFGHIEPGKPLPVPYALADHYRVIDQSSGKRPFELFDVLQRIKSVLEGKQHYDFINLSLGPKMPIDDDEVHAWTALLDSYLASGKTLATIAVGNYDPGESDRIQVPADCVNALAIGACDHPGDGWARTPYSAKGPGRSPGLIKPDLVDFGGIKGRLFTTIHHDGSNTTIGSTGTSVASPATLRMGVGIRAHFANKLNMLAIRALMVHSSENNGIPASEVGWGRVARSLDNIVISNDHTVRIVYQGSIAPRGSIRVPIPFPTKLSKGKIRIIATLCYATVVDPDHPDNYTRSGLIPIFRPDKTKFESGSSNPKTKSFFSKKQDSRQHMSEEDLRKDAWKWENCMHGSMNFFDTTLNEPLFDIHYNARTEGHDSKTNQKIDYAMIITVEAPAIADFYDQVVRRYATRLEAIQPAIDIPLRTSN